MKQLNRITGLVAVFAALLLVSCSKETIDETAFYNFDQHIGRYVFDVEQTTFVDGNETIDYSTAVGYVRKVSNHQIKVLFDAFTPKVDCKYEYLVRPDGSLYSISTGVGERGGSFTENGIELTQKVNLSTKDFYILEISGLQKAN